MRNCKTALHRTSPQHNAPQNTSVTNIMTKGEVFGISHHYCIGEGLRLHWQKYLKYDWRASSLNGALFELFELSNSDFVLVI
jgi:hypothetical protein